MTAFRLPFVGLCFALLLGVVAPSAADAASSSNRTPIAGDWIPASPGDEIGYYHSDLRTFYLCRDLFAEFDLDCVEYRVLDWGVGLPLMGRWQPGDTVARPALYDPSTGNLRTYRYSDCLPAQCVTSGGLTSDATYQLGLRSATPVAGDWDGSGVDSVALVQPYTPGKLSFNGQVKYFDDGFRTFSGHAVWNYDLRGYTPIGGDWPDTFHRGDSLGFYDSNDHTILLLDGTSSIRSESLPISFRGLPVFGLDLETGGSGIGLYFPPPPHCPSLNCHRVDLWSLPSLMFAPGQVEPPYPHMDSRFPDDPGDPTPTP
ncbi:MAG: hypothetical protein AAFY88_15575 [Acidobacteriota bacterium]